MNTSKTVESVLATYTLEEILDENGVSASDALYVLIEHGVVELPEVKPVDIEWEDDLTIDGLDDFDL